MAVICKDLKLLYIQVPGTGCSVVGKRLRDRFGGEDLGRKHNDVPELIQKGLVSEEVLRDYLVVANVRNPFDRMVTYYQRLNGPGQEEYLAWVRRDLARQRARGGVTEKEYRQRMAARPGIEVRKRRRAWLIRRFGFNPWLLITLLRWHLRNGRRGGGEHELRFTYHLFPMIQRVDVVLKQERLEEALNAVLQQVGVKEPTELPSKNITKGKKPYATYYTNFTRLLMGRLCRRELAFMGYTFEGDSSGEAVIHLTDKRLTL